jgi:hypothetical protein
MTLRRVHRRICVGDTVQSLLNDSVGVVECASLREDGTVRLWVRKTGGTKGWAKIGEIYPESTAECRRVVP